ncbi:MAG: site-specific DNA-methyltransferase [Chloroflexi bacterium]|nr:site-specific DNA-methyltransferase [Chloroflexota bacterium]MCY4248208.1 site-specific DNA-methyltransferase [Chloroflexota bacterium]
MKLNSILRGDCIKLLRNIPDESVDIAFADPPFNLKKRYSSYRDNLELSQYIEWCNLWLRELVRVTKPTGSIFIHNIPKWLAYFSAELNKIADFKHWIAWDAMSTPLGKTLLPTHYGILYYAKDATKLKFYDIRYPHHRCRKCGVLRKDYGGKKSRLHPFGPIVSDVWTDLHRIKHNKRRDRHPCQLPIHLLERLLLLSTDEGDVVLDPFMGTGTTAVAAKRLGRNFIGIEIDENYVQIANDNLADTNEKTKIGASWVSLYLNQVATLRDVDWRDIKKYFEIPAPIKRIDSVSIKYSNGKQQAEEQDIDEIPPEHKELWDLQV